MIKNVKSEDLRTVTTINFDSWEDKELAWKFYNSIVTVQDFEKS